MRKFISWIEAGSTAALEDCYTRRTTVKKYFLDIMFLFLAVPLAILRVLTEPLNIVIIVVTASVVLGVALLVGAQMGVDILTR